MSLRHGTRAFEKENSFCADACLRKLDSCPILQIRLVFFMCLRDLRCANGKTQNTVQANTTPWALREQQSSRSDEQEAQSNSLTRAAWSILPTSFPT